MTRKRVGEVRPSQVMHTFGIGSVVDLPHFSAVVMGLQDWDDPSPGTVIPEERLLGLVRSYLGPQIERLSVPPAQSDNDGSTTDPFDEESLRGVPLAPFPKWVRCTLCDLMAPMDSGLFELKHNPYRPDQTKYVHKHCARARGNRWPTVVPARHLRACEHGHVDDFPWVDYVHQGPTSCRYELYLREFGVSAEAADIVVTCKACNSSMPMAPAFNEDQRAAMGDWMISCSGNHPHIRHRASSCDVEMRPILAGASNLWFPVNAAVLTIPTAEGLLAQRIKDHWDKLGILADMAQVTLARTLNEEVNRTFAEWTDEQIWQAIEKEREGAAGEVETIGTYELKKQEWEVFTEPDSVPASENLQMEEVSAPPGYEDLVERVVLLKRLREVSALIGFTRIISPGDYADLDEIPEIRRATIDRAAPRWVPVSETRGEGIFIQFKEEAIANWEEDPTVIERDRAFGEAHTAFRASRRIENPSANYFGIRYVLMHSFSHALIRQFSIECGYGAASIRERIYAAHGAEPMAGVLLYTAAPDSEGTLGGLVALGSPRTLSRHLDQAMEDMRLCASDPLCAEHEPTDQQALVLHGAACHACLFASETSCERSNKYLDRSLLVSTFSSPARPFFPDYSD